MITRKQTNKQTKFINNNINKIKNDTRVAQCLTTSLAISSLVINKFIIFVTTCSAKPYSGAPGIGCWIYLFKIKEKLFYNTKKK